VKIKGTCKRCGREFLAEQAIANGAVCPWDGEPFSLDYAAVLVDALRDSQVAGTRLEHALEAVADIRPAFTLDAESVLGHIRSQIARLERNLITQT
jgi:hypothetical protein